MSDPQAGGHPDRFEVRVTAESHFAWLRTRLAVERTMMAYMRTAVALIGFGFTIFQFLDRVQEVPGRTVYFPRAAWYLSLSLIFCGVAAAVASRSRATAAAYSGESGMALLLGRRSRS